MGETGARGWDEGNAHVDGRVQALGALAGRLQVEHLNVDHGAAVVLWPGWAPLARTMAPPIESPPMSTIQ